MQFMVSGTAIVMGVLSALWVVCVGAVGLWVRRVQLDTDTDRKLIGQVQTDLADLREMVARDYASRDEVRNERQEVRELLAQINAKIDDLIKTVIHR